MTHALKNKAVSWVDDYALVNLCSLCSFHFANKL